MLCVLLPAISGDWAAIVNGSPISADRFRQAARGLDQQYRDTFGEQYESLRPSLRVGSQVINSLIVNEIIHRDAERIEGRQNPNDVLNVMRTKKGARHLERAPPIQII